MPTTKLQMNRNIDLSIFFNVEFFQNEDFFIIIFFLLFFSHWPMAKCAVFNMRNTGLITYHVYLRVCDLSLCVNVNVNMYFEAF